MNKKYFDLFESIDSVHSQWNGSGDVWDSEVLIAVYSYEDYSGSAFLLYERNGVLYEVHDAHCSCYGLENWVSEVTSWAALSMRNYTEYGREFDAAYKALISSHA